MLLSMSKSELVRYVSIQLDHFFPDNLSIVQSEIMDCIDYVLERVEFCFSFVHNRYFQLDGKPRFNHLHSDHYSMFLYFLSNTLFNEGKNVQLCEKVFYLNKVINGVDAFYEVKLPDIFLFCHPLGSVLGRAAYSNYLLVNQQVTVGAAREAKPGEKSIFPVLGEYCSLYKDAAILGNCHVGYNCKISAHSLLIDQDLEDNSIYIGNRLSHSIKRNRAPDNIWGVFSGS